MSRNCLKALTSIADTGAWISLYASDSHGEVCALKWLNINFEILNLNCKTHCGTDTENGVEIHCTCKVKVQSVKFPILCYSL